MSERDYIFNITFASDLNKILDEPGRGVRCTLKKFKTMKQLKTYMKEINKHILILQPERSCRHYHTLIVIDQELRFWDMNKIEDGELPSKKCSVCKINEIPDTSLLYGTYGNKMCDDCRKTELVKRETRQLKKIKKDLTKFFRNQNCKYIEFKKTWTYFYKNYKMNRYDFDRLFVKLITNSEIRLNLELLSTKTGPHDYGSENCFQWQDYDHHKYRKDDLFLLWTITGI